MNTYVALGDSVASGLGAPPYLGSTCWQSEKSYPSLLAAELGVAKFVFNACGGALTADVVTRQQAGLDESVQLVTITVGVNDLTISSDIATCLSATESDCLAALRDAVRDAKDMLPDRLAAVFGAVRQRAPQATFVVTGYPHFFEPDAVAETMPCVSRTKRVAFNEAVDALDAMIADQAARAGALFADVRPRFATHGLCGGDPWFAGFTDPAAFHPTASGYAHGYLPVIRTLLDRFS